MEITVALIADPDNPFQKTASEEEWAKPYAQRPKVRMEVSEHDTLAKALDDAARSLGIAHEQVSSRFGMGWRAIAFYKPEDEDGFADRFVPRYLMSQVVLVDDQGRAMFGVSDARTIRFSDLISAAQAGTIDGDPARPYLIIEPGYGDVPPPDWPTVVAGLEVALDILERVAAAGGAWFFAKEIVKAIRERLRRGTASAKNHPEWAQRGSSPYQFRALFATHQWRSTDLAALLGCSDDEAEGVLWALGFAFDEDEGNWKLEADDAAAIIETISREIAIANHRGYGDWTEALRQRLLYFFEHGSSPPLDYPLETTERPIYAPTIGERIGNAIDSVLWRLRRR